MSLPVPSDHSHSPPPRPQLPEPPARAPATTARSPVLLDQALEQARQHLAASLHALPEPWPGCVLVFSVAHADALTSVFRIKAHTFQSAWREGTIRVRQWAWASRLDTAVLRIDWAEEVVLYPAGHVVSASELAQWRSHNSALADLGCDHTILLQQALLVPAAELPAWAGAIIAGHPSPEPFVVLHMRGIFLDPHSTAPTHLPRKTLPPWHVLAAPAVLDSALHHAGHAAIMGMIGQQLPTGSWPHSSALSAHLHIQYCLLLLLRAQPSPAHARAAAIEPALARANDYAASAAPANPQEQAWALLVLCLSTTALNQPAHPAGPRQAALHRLAQQTAQAHSQLNPHNAGTLGILQRLALHAYAQCCTSTADLGIPSSLAWTAQWPAESLSLLSQSLANAPHTGPPWLGMALIEACQGPAESLDASQHSPLLLQRTLQQLNALQQRFVWPETAIYMQPRPPAQLLFTAAPWPTATAQAQPPIAQQAQWLNHAAACVAVLRCLARSAVASSASSTNGQALAVKAPAPMPWSGQCLALLMAGQWHLPHGMAVPAAISGLSVTRQHHGQGAAVLVRHAADGLGVPAAVAASLQPCALVQMRGNPLPPNLPVLEIADLDAALLRLAERARQRVQGQVIGVTGCVGKTSTLRMLAQCLFGYCSAQQDAIVQHAPALQMVHWSDSAPWVLAELPWSDAPAHVPRLAPDVLVVTNLPPAPTATTPCDQPHSHAQRSLQILMSQMRPGSLMVVHSGLLEPQLLQRLAASCHVRLSSFGPDPSATVYERGYEDNGQLHLQLSQTDMLTVQLQANGQHMALNAQAALAVLHAMQWPLASSAAALRHWSPLPGAGLSEYLPGNRVLLDHSNTSALQATQAAFAQLLRLAPHASQRLIVFGGIQAGGEQAEHLPAAQMQLELLLRSTPARRVWLYGQAMAPLLQQVQDLHHVSWHEDLNQLIESLLRALQAHDTVLLVGRAIVNLSLAAQAIREVCN